MSITAHVGSQPCEAVKEFVATMEGHKAAFWRLTRGARLHSKQMEALQLHRLNRTDSKSCRTPTRMPSKLATWLVWHLCHLSGLL